MDRQQTAAQLNKFVGYIKKVIYFYFFQLQLALLGRFKNSKKWLGMFAIEKMFKFRLKKIMKIEEVKDLWIKFNEYSNKLANVLGRTSNIVGEYAEYLACRYYEGEMLGISDASADFKTRDGNLYQVKARKIKRTPTTQLSIIRSWGFDFLIVVLFDENGTVEKALEVPMEVAKEYGVHNNHQNGWVITTTKDFLNDHRSQDITLLLNSASK